MESRVRCTHLVFQGSEPGRRVLPEPSSEFEVSLSGASTGVMSSRTAAQTELRIPADRDYIVVAKRTAAAMASVAGLGVEALDELNIAIAEACEHTIGAALSAGFADAKVRIGFSVQEDALRVDVRLLTGKAEPQERTAAAVAASPLAETEALDMAIQMLRCFADDVDFQAVGSGLMHVRLAKYRWR